MEVNEMDAKVRELRILQSISKQISDKIAVIEDYILYDMTRQQVETLSGGDWCCTLHTKKVCLVNVNAMRKESPTAFTKYCKPYTQKTLCVE